MTVTTANSTSTAKDSLLRFAIRLDGVVVALLGVAMVATAGTVTGLPTAVEYGAGLLSIAYGPLAFVLAARPKVRSTGMVLAAVNVGTTIALIALCATGVASLTTTGVGLALAVAGYTAAVGALQYVGVRRAA